MYDPKTLALKILLKLFCNHPCLTFHNLSEDRFSLSLLFVLMLLSTFH